MPKISGFEMLDILRGTPGVQNTKVVMMTALSQAEDKARASALGADRYLVKSQVTLEDVVQTAKDVLEGTSAPTPLATTAQAATPPTTTNSNPVTPPVAPAPTSATSTSSSTPASNSPNVTFTPIPVAQPSSQISATDIATTSTDKPDSSAAPAAPSTTTVDQDLSQSSASEETAISQQIEGFVNTTTPAEHATSTQPQTTSSDTTTTPAEAEQDKSTSITGQKVIQPLNDPNANPDLDLLLAKEQQEELDKANVQPVVDDKMPPAESSGYLSAPQAQPGQTNPNHSNNPSLDPGNITL